MIPSRSTVLATAALLAIVAAILWSTPPANAQQPPIVGFEVINYTVAEPSAGTESVVFNEVTITLGPASTQTVTVDLTVEEISARRGADFLLDDQTITFTPGTTSVTVPITIVRSDNVEQTERFRMNLSNASGAQAAPSVAQVTITDNDIADGWLVVHDAIEGQPIQVDIHFSTPHEYRVSINIVNRFTEDTGPLDHVDYDGTDIMDELQTKKTIYLPTYQDNQKEGLERARFDLRNPASIYNSLGTAYYPYIIDDDIPLDVRASTTTRPQSSIERRSLAVPEGDSANFLVWLSRPPNKPVTITPHWASSGDPDFSFSPPSVTFTPDDWYHKTITVNAAEDDDVLAGTRTLRFTTQSEDSRFRGKRLKEVYVTEQDDDVDDDGHIIHSEEHSEVTNGITTSIAYAPHRRTGDRFWMMVQFSEPITSSYNRVRHTIRNAVRTNITKLHRVDNRKDLWAFEISPQSHEEITHFQVPGNRPCSEGICGSGGKRLANTLTYSVATADTDAKLPPGIGPTPVISASDQSVAEGAGNLQFLITLDEASTEPVTFDLLASSQRRSGHATDSKDYQAAYRTITIDAGDTSHIASIKILDDDEAEGNEVFNIILMNASGAEFEGAANQNKSLTATITIVDDD